MSASLRFPGDNAHTQPNSARTAASPDPFRVLSLFSGIGGFELGLERAGGFVTVAQCEIDPFCRRVLEKHWPHVKRYEDVRELTAERLAADGIGVDVICGGFPCQDISVAGTGAGIAGERSGLWSEYARLVGELRPRFVLVENVAALLGRGLDRVLGDLAEIGFDAEWHCIPASAVGAPHRRDRIWIVAYPGDSGQRQLFQSLGELGGGIEADLGGNGEIQSLADPESGGCGAGRPRRLDCLGARLREQAPPAADVADADEQHRRAGEGQGSGRRIVDRLKAGDSGWWQLEPDVGRVAHGVPARVDRLRALGNAVVPEIPYRLGRAILTAEGRA